MLQSAMDAAAVVFVTAGVFFFIVSTVGLLRLPDVYTRLHATSKADTLGAGLCLIGAILHLGWTLTSIKLLLVVVFIWVTSPTAAHLIGKAAYRARVRPACGEFAIFDVREEEDS